jgi:hypothetical protein
MMSFAYNTVSSLAARTASCLRATVPIFHLTILATLIAGSACISYAQSGYQSQTKLTTSIAEPVVLNIGLAHAEMQIAYAREGEVSVTAFDGDRPATSLTQENELASRVLIEQSGNQITIKDVPNELPASKMTYRIDVPYRTIVQSHVLNGRQSVTGVLGPVHVTTNTGAISVSYVSGEVSVESGNGNLDLQVIGSPVKARTARGNISCSRIPKGIDAETDDGDITLMVVGPSKATINRGSGRVEAGGIRGSFTAATATGDVHIKAVPHDSWHVKSTAGNIRIELPPGAGFDLEAVTSFGEISSSRDDLPESEGDTRHLHQKANGGGKDIELRTDSGAIVIG